MAFYCSCRKDINEELSLFVDKNKGERGGERVNKGLIEGQLREKISKYRLKKSELSSLISHTQSKIDSLSSSLDASISDISYQCELTKENRFLFENKLSEKESVLREMRNDLCDLENDDFEEETYDFHVYMKDEESSDGFRGENEADVLLENELKELREIFVHDIHVHNKVVTEVNLLKKDIINLEKQQKSERRLKSTIGATALDINSHTSSLKSAGLSNKNIKSTTKNSVKFNTDEDNECNLWDLIDENDEIKGEILEKINQNCEGEDLIFLQFEEGMEDTLKNGLLDVDINLGVNNNQDRKSKSKSSNKTKTRNVAINSPIPKLNFTQLEYNSKNKALKISSDKENKAKSNMTKGKDAKEDKSKAPNLKSRKKSSFDSFSSSDFEVKKLRENIRRLKDKIKNNRKIIREFERFCRDIVMKIN